MDPIVSLLSRLLPRFPSMRPFERKIALITTAIDLIYTLDFLTEEQKAGIVTLTVKNDTKPCIVKIVNANRDKLIREQFLPDIEKLLSEEKSHEEICDELVQMKYEVRTCKSDSLGNAYGSYGSLLYCKCTGKRKIR